MPQIDVNNTFCVFLQNPNGLSVYKDNLLLLADLQRCYDYGAATVCLPETKTNWDQTGQLATCHCLFKKSMGETLLRARVSAVPRYHYQ
jgi:hypothetical protein